MNSKILGFIKDNPDTWEKYAKLWICARNTKSLRGMIVTDLNLGGRIYCDIPDDLASKIIDEIRSA